MGIVALDTNSRLPEQGDVTISVIIPAFNAAAYIGATLQSVINQSRQPLEIIVVDDGSSDDTVAIARSFCVHIISLTNRGPSAARNTGVAAARGTYVALIDADDLWTPQKLEKQLAALQSFSRPAFSITDYRSFDNEGAHVRESELNAHAAFRRSRRPIARTPNFILDGSASGPVLADSYIPPSSVLVTRAHYLAAGGFDESLRMTEDYEFHLRLLQRIPAIAVMEPLLLYRRHRDQASAKLVTGMAGFVAVAQLVAARPERYPKGEVEFLARTEFLRQYRVGFAHARLGEFAEAAQYFRASLRARKSLQAYVALAASIVAGNDVGIAVVEFARRIWKARPRRR